jgi:hypothetical protein
LPSPRGGGGHPALDIRAAQQQWRVGLGLAIFDAETGGD